MIIAIKHVKRIIMILIWMLFEKKKRDNYEWRRIFVLDRISSIDRRVRKNLNDLRGKVMVRQGGNSKRNFYGASRSGRNDFQSKFIGATGTEKKKTKRGTQKPPQLLLPFCPFYRMSYSYSSLWAPLLPSL